MAQATAPLSEQEALRRQFALRKPTSLYRDAWRRLIRNRGSVVGMIIVGVFALVGIFARSDCAALAAGAFREQYLPQPVWINLPNDPLHTGDPRFILGTDTIGRDVLSRVIFGARTSMAVGFIPMVLIILIGTTDRHDRRVRRRLG